MRRALVAGLLVGAALAQEPAKRAKQPPARSGHALVFDPIRKQMLLLGGDHRLPKTSDGDDLWGLGEHGWSKVGITPPPLALAAVAWDTAHRNLLVQGGSGSDAKIVGATILWDGAAWETVQGAGPGARDHHAGAYDEARERVVLFGGQPTPGQYHGDTWEFDGAAWKKVDDGGAGRPAPRLHHAMAYDASLEKVLLFGGCDARREFGDTWEWDGKAWMLAAKESSDGPSPRTGARMAYDAKRERVVLFGGSARQACGDTWTFEGSGWKRVEFPPGSPTPPARSHHALAYDAARGKLVLFGGYDGSANLADTWELDERGWHELSSAKEDGR